MSFGAQLVNTSGYSVQVTSGVADMDQFYAEQYKDATAKPLRLMTVGAKKDGMVNAKMAYDLYLPKGVSAENPAPAVALTHGYLNSKEFEEGFAVAGRFTCLVSLVYTEPLTDPNVSPASTGVFSTLAIWKLSF